MGGKIAMRERFPIVTRTRTCHYKGDKTLKGAEGIIHFHPVGWHGAETSSVETLPILANLIQENAAPTPMATPHLRG